MFTSRSALFNLTLHELHRVSKVTLSWWLLFSVRTKFGIFSYQRHIGDRASPKRSRFISKQCILYRVEWIHGAIFSYYIFIMVCSKRLFLCRSYFDCSFYRSSCCIDLFKRKAFSESWSRLNGTTVAGFLDQLINEQLRGPFRSSEESNTDFNWHFF